MQENKIKSKRKWLKWLLFLMVAILLMITYAFYQFKEEADLRRENVKIQQDKMVEFWKNEGLTQEEIDQKLKEERSQLIRNEDPSIFQSVFRTVRHATGTGPGTGTR